MGKKPIVIGIYKITSPSTTFEGGRIYIGQSIDIYKRWDTDYQLCSENPTHEKCKTQEKLYNSFKKYGVANHQFEIIEIISEADYTQEFLDEREIYYIDFFDTFNTPHGLNLKRGNNRGRWSDESKAKISFTKKGVSNYKIKGEGNGMYGKTRSEEEKKLMSEKRTGINLGLKHSEETKRKIGDAQIGAKNHRFGKKPHNLGIPHSDEVRMKMKESWIKRKLKKAI